MSLRRRISATYKDLPGGQVLGPTFDYTHRLIDFALAAEGEAPVAAKAEPLADAAHAPRVTDLLGRDGLIEPSAPDDGTPPGDLTREPLDFPADRALRLQALARGDEGFVLALGYSNAARLRPHPPLRRGDPGRHGRGRVRAEELGLLRAAGRDRPHRVPDGQPVPRQRRGAAAIHPRLRASPSARASARRWRWPSSTGRSGPRSWASRSVLRRRTRNSCWPIATRSGDRLRRAPEAAPLRRFPGELELVRRLRAEHAARQAVPR